MVAVALNKFKFAKTSLTALRMWSEANKFAAQYKHWERSYKSWAVARDSLFYVAELKSPRTIHQIVFCASEFVYLSE